MATPIPDIGTAHPELPMHATLEEIWAALRKLSDADYFRLLSYARSKMHGSHQSPEDLVSRAVVSALLAAQGGRGRHWPTNVEFIKFLAMTVRSIADGERRSRRQRQTRNGHFGPDGLEPSDLAHEFPFPSSSQPIADFLITQEDQVSKEKLSDERLQQVRELFAGDVGVQWIMFGIQEELPARAIQAMSGMNSTQYATALRRWNRGLNRLFPARRNANER
jgi:hypothetical protein